MKKIFILMLIFSLFMLSSCGNKGNKTKSKEVVVNLCYINYDNIMDNNENLDIIDEGCKMAKVDNWKNICEPNKKYSFKVTVLEGYYIKRYAFVQSYSIKDAKFNTDIKDNTVEVIPIEPINYIVFDFQKIEE